MKNFAYLLIVLFAFGLQGHAQTRHKVTLHWIASPTTAVDHYGLYRGIVSGGPYQLMGKVPANQVTFINGSNPDGTALVEGQTYYYVVVAFQGALFSTNSNELPVTIPTNPKSAQQLSGDVE